MWLRSRERALREKLDGYCCQRCGAKKSVAKGREVKIEIHHIDGIRWAKIIEYIRRELLVKPDQLFTLCKQCHLDEHKEDK